MTADKKEPEKILSFRRYLQSEVSEFVSGFKQFELTTELLAEFIVVLSTYQEEGSHLFPAVFISEDLNEILTVAKGSDAILIGSGAQTREYVHQAFKKCAPLAENRAWAIFVTMKKKTLNYGIFRTDQSPLSPTSFERLRQSSNPSLNIVGLSRLGGSFVEIRTGGGQFQYVNMTGDQEETGNPKQVIRGFMKLVTKDCSTNLQSQLQSFYYRVGYDIMQSTHGTLVAVIPHNRSVPGIFNDGVLLEPRINVLEGISKLIAEGGNESFQQLIAWNQLIRRMTSMDGITVIDSSGAIVGYNYFIKNSALEAKPKSALLGGARRRAFEVLRSHLGADLSGVIYKSRDGGVELGTIHDIFPVG